MNVNVVRRSNILDHSNLVSKFLGTKASIDQSVDHRREHSSFIRGMVHGVPIHNLSSIGGLPVNIKTKLRGTRLGTAEEEDREIQKMYGMHPFQE